jgi:hypothetical protein
MNLTLEDKCYIAGFIDGEGTITLTYQHKKQQPNGSRTLTISVSSTSYNILQFFKDKCGGSIKTHKSRKKHYKQAYSWKIGVNKSLSLLELITPFLKEPEKVRRANLILKNYKNLTPRNGKYNKDKLLARDKFIQDFFKNSCSVTNI